MGQTEVLQVLKKAEKPMAVKEIAEHVDCNISSLYSNAIAKMREKGEIDYIEKTNKWKQNVKYYYLEDEDENRRR